MQLSVLSFVEIFHIWLHNFANPDLDLQVTVTGAGSEAEAAKIARSVASSSLVKAWNPNSIFWCFCIEGFTDFGNVNRLQYMEEIQTGDASPLQQAMRAFLLIKLNFEYC